MSLFFLVASCACSPCFFFALLLSLPVMLTGWSQTFFSVKSLLLLWQTRMRTGWSLLLLLCQPSSSYCLPMKHAHRLASASSLLNMHADRLVPTSSLPDHACLKVGLCFFFANHACCIVIRHITVLQFTDRQAQTDRQTHTHTTDMCNVILEYKDELEVAVAISFSTLLTYFVVSRSADITAHLCSCVMSIVLLASSGQ